MCLSEVTFVLFFSFTYRILHDLYRLSLVSDIHIYPGLDWIGLGFHHPRYPAWSILAGVGMGNGAMEEASTYIHIYCFEGLSTLVYFEEFSCLPTGPAHLRLRGMTGV